MSVLEQPRRSSIVARVRASISRPLWSVCILIAAMLAVAAVVYVLVVRHSGAPLPDRLPYGPWILAVAFAATEIFVVHLELKREAHSISLSEIPVAIGLFFVSPLHFIAARVVGSTAGLVLHRKQRGIKLAFNVVNFALESTVAVAVFAVLRPQAPFFGPRSWVATILTLTAVNVMTAITVTAAIGLSQRKLNLAVLRQVLIAGLVAGFVNAVIGLVAAESLYNSKNTSWLLVFPAAMLFLGYRGYASLAQRHSRLRLLYDYVRAIRRSPELEGSIADMLEHARKMLRADGAELWLHASPTEVRSFSLRADAPLAVAERVGPAPWTRAFGDERSTLIARTTKDPVERKILDELGSADLVAVPVRDEENVIGTLCLFGRLGDIATFDSDDLRLLESLANQASTSLANGRLIDRLRNAVAANEHLAHHDPLTGLPNRVLFDRLVREALDEPEPRPAVMLMDLDRFKEINDTLGHATGDELLRELGARLTVKLPSVGISRLGGDEFAILCPRVATVEAALETATAALEALKEPFDVSGLALQVDASIGIALAPDHGADPESLLRKADVAMYAAKSSGSRITVYEQGLDHNTVRRLSLVGELRLALDRGELSLNYQPKIDMATNQIVGVEALLRWRHPKHGPQSPEEFIPAAEQTGLIRPLTLWVIRRALEQCRAWEADGFMLGIAVNLSARNLSDPRLTDDIRAMLEEVGVPASRLTLEITETAIMADPARAAAVLERLRGLGVRLSVDDFGAGYTSLLYLKRLPVNEMKIDRSFVTNLSRNPDDAAIVSYVVGLGNTLGLTVVAEGVEDPKTYEELRTMGVDVSQGYLISRALPSGVLTNWLRAFDAGSARDLRFLRAV